MTQRLLRKIIAHRDRNDDLRMHLAAANTAEMVTARGEPRVEASGLATSHGAGSVAKSPLESVNPGPGKGSVTSKGRLGEAVSRLKARPISILGLITFIASASLILSIAAHQKELIAGAKAGDLAFRAVSQGVNTVESTIATRTATPGEVKGAVKGAVKGVVKGAVIVAVSGVTMGAEMGAEMGAVRAAVKNAVKSAARVGVWPRLSSPPSPRGPTRKAGGCS
jgi:hypothetical protein